jgi:predicted metal-dependent hydrolase
VVEYPSGEMEPLESRTIDLGGRQVSYALCRSRRARRIRADAGLRTGLRVTLPEGMSDQAVEPFLKSHRRWVLRTLRRFERLSTLIPDRTLAHGTTVPFLGRELRLDLSIGLSRVGRLADTLIIHVPRRTRAAVHRALETWYRSEALSAFEGWVRDLSQRHALAFRKIVIGDQKRRWGTCYSNGTLSFNWRLMLAPEPVARYLAAHELSHVASPDHSDRFWSKVGELCPDYREAEAWLRKRGVSLVL